MIYINKKNFYIRVIMALVIIASVWLSFQGGIDFVNAKASASDVPDPYEPTNPLTEKALQKHVSSTALNNYYSVEFKQTVRTDEYTIKEHTYDIEISNSETVGFKSEEYSGTSVENRFTEKYETSEMLYTNDNGEVTETERGGEDYSSPILQNQFVNAGLGVNEFNVFTWTVADVTEEKLVYDLARADAVAIDNLSTIDSASGEIIINRETGYIETMEVYISGSSAEHPTETVYVTYTYDVTTGDTVSVTQPDWLPEGATTSASETTGDEN